MSARDGFARHAEEQRLRWLSLTPEERLRWLERAKRFARIALAARRATDGTAAGDAPAVAMVAATPLFPLHVPSPSEEPVSSKVPSSR